MEIIQLIIIALFFIFAGILLFLAYSILRDNPSNRMNRVAALMLFFASWGPIFLAFGEIVRPNVSAEAPFEESFIHNLYYSWELFIPALLLFSWVYPVDRFSHLKRPRLRYLIFLPQIFHLILVVIFRNPENILNILEIESSEGFISLILEPLTSVLKWIALGFTLLLSSERALFGIINSLYIGSAIYFMIRGWMLLSGEQVKRQSTILIWGITAAVGLFALTFLITDVLSIDIHQNLKKAILIIVFVIGIGAISWSIIRRRFLDVTVIVRQSLVYTITSGLLVGLYILLVGQTNRFLGTFFGEMTTIVNIAFIVLALIFFQPINNKLDNFIKRFFIKSQADYRNIMEQISRQFVAVLDPERLLKLIEKTMTSTIMISRIFFVLFDDKIKEYVLLPSEDFPEQMVINRKDLFLGGVGQQDKPVMMERLSIYGENSKLYTEMLKRRVEVILPLKDEEHMLGYLALTGRITGFRYNAEDLTMLGVISNQLVTVLTNARLYLESLERRRLEEEIAMARQIQIDLLPKSPPAPKHHSIHAYSLPSRTIGGDFYDFIPKDNEVFGMVIADASGKGMQAALIVTQIQAMLRAEAGNNNDLSKIIGNVNRYVTILTSSEKFATLFYGEYNPFTRELRYSNAGHNYPIVVRADGSYELLSRGGTVIGAFGASQYEEDIVRLNDGDLIFMYTDGLSEAQNEFSEHYDEYGEERIIDFVINKRTLPPEELVSAILDDVKLFDPADPPRDDTTIIVLKALKGDIP